MQDKKNGQVTVNILHCIYLIREGDVPLQSPFIPSVVITPRMVPSITEE